MPPPSKALIETLPLIASSVVAASAIVSSAVYICSKSTSPFNRGSKLSLPVSRNEALHPVTEDEKDPFDIYDPVLFDDGVPIDPTGFWRRIRRRKIALLVSLLPAATWNAHLLVQAILGAKPPNEIVPPALIAASHLVCLTIAYRSISLQETDPHWASIIHLSVLLSINFLVSALLGLLPASEAPIGIVVLIGTREKLLSMVPALLNVIPALQAVTIPRGPALHLPLEKLLTAKAINSAKEASAESLDAASANVSAEAQANVLEWLIFSSATPVIWKAYKSDSTELWELPAYLANHRAMRMFADIRKAYGKTQKTRGRSKSLFKRDGYNILIKLANVNRGPFAAQAAIAAVTAVVYYAPAFFLNRVISYLEADPDRTDMSWGWVWCFGLFFSNLTVYLAVGVLWSISTVTLQARIKLQLNTLLYSKTLVKKDVGGAGVATQDKTLEVGEAKNTDNETKEATDKDEDEDVNSKSQIMTLFTVDVDRVAEFVFHVFVLVDAPIELVVATCFLIKLLGVSALFGLLATVVFIPMQHYASRFVVDTQENLMKTRDERTALMNEILGGIRMLKFMAWERSFQKKVDTVRRKELGWLRRNYAIEVAFSCIWAVSPIIVTVVAFLHFTLVRGEKLTPSIAFTSVGVFNELRFALNSLPETFINMLQGFVSCRRIEKYMRAAEVLPVNNPDEGVDITLNSATITWPRDRAPDGIEGQASGQATAAPSVAATPKVGFTLSDLNLSFPNGQLSLVCGKLGSGKTLLLLGLLGEADLLAGQIICPRSTPNAMDDIGQKVSQEDWILANMCAYVPQQAWLQNATIKDNIVFCSPWDEERYERVLDACSLRTDLSILEDGDQTEIGEKGLNLSGGQKARVSLARAVYSRAGTLFLDDVISAVDALTAHALVDNCLQGDLIQGRTVIMVSHHTALVAPAAAYVVALENGDVKFAGSFTDFEASGLSRTFDEAKLGPGDEKEESALKKKAASPEAALIDLDNHPSGASSVIETASAPETVVPPIRKTPRKLIEDEKKERGRVAKEVWFMYFKALGGPFFWIIFALSLLIAMAVPVAENGWLQFWSGSFVSGDYRHTPEFYVGWFAVISIVGNLLVQLKLVVIYTGSLRASAKMHDRLLESVLFATLRFHDTTNRGRLLNRFGKDIEGLDSSTADNFVRSLTDATSLLVTFASITYIGGWPFLLACFFFLALYFQFAKIYGPASRDMRRLDSITKSPMYSAFGDAVAGGAVIRAFGASTLSLREMMRSADTNILAYYWTWTVNRWCSARCGILSSCMVGCTAFAVLIAPGVSAAAAGFALAFSENISAGMLQGIRQFVRLEQSMVALERLKEYTHVPREAAEIVEPRPHASWPEAGEVRVEDLVIKYAPDLPNVLHKISFEVKPKMHVGVVGSTGSGKSTLALSFFRFVEATEGRIVIDGIDISKIGLTDLRSRVTIIPQDPTILSGTLRSTLDVFDEYDDADIFDALKRTHLLEESSSEGDADAQSTDASVERNKNVFKDLSSPVNEGGDNFSQGEKQLICMARAILKRNRLLIMDEATASVDYETDELISKTIREEFRDSTILTIAHRIHTVIDFDKILVMDQGRIAEYASPAELLRNHNSKFYALCKATGAEFKVLKTLAFAAEERRRSGEH